MLDNLLQNAQLILVVVPGNGSNNNNIAASLLNSVAGVNSGYSHQPQQPVDVETAAVIAAAVSNVVTQPHRVRKIQFIQDQGNSAWSQIGRLNVIASHDTRR